MCFQWHLHIISRPSPTWGNSLQLKAYLLLSCLTMDLPSMEKNLGNLPVNLTSYTPHHHPISINQMDSSRPWWRKSRMLTRKWMDPPMLRLEHYSSYVTHPSWQTSHPQQRFYMVIPLKEQSLSRPSKRVNICQIRQRLVELQEKKKENFDKAHRAKDLHILKVKEQVQFFTTNKAQAPLSGQLAQWLKYWNVDNPTWFRALMAESTEGTELIWSPYVMTAPPFKTIQWQNRRNSPKTFPFKTISPARPNPCLSRRKPVIWIPGPCCLMNLTHIKHPQHHPHCHPWGTTHLNHHHAHPQHHSHPENHLWSPVQRTPHPKAGRDTSLNQLSSDPMTLTKDSHMDFQPC